MTLLDDIFTGQTGANVYFNSDSLLDTNGTTSLVSYFGDGNIYNPASGGYVATVIDSAAPTTTARSATTPNTGTSSNTAPASSTPYGDSGPGIGYRSDQRSLLAAPMFVNSAGGDFRLANVAPNYMDTGAAQVYGRTHLGVSPTVWDAQGNSRVQGNAVDAGAYETAGPSPRPSLWPRPAPPAPVFTTATATWSARFGAA